MGFLDTAAAWLDSTLATSDGVTVRYSRGIPYVDVTAVLGQTPTGFDLGNGILQTWQTQDFLIPQADFELSGSDVSPQVGDEVRSGDVVFRVCLADDGRCWRFTDPYRRTMRIHTKEVC